jgi:hypothetical protein
MPTLRVELTADDRVYLYAARLAAGFRLFEPGGYDPAEEDAAEAAEGYVLTGRERKTILDKRRKPVGACSFGTCCRMPRPGGGTCQKHYEQARERRARLRAQHAG